MYVDNWSQIEKRRGYSPEFIRRLDEKIQKAATESRLTIVETKNKVGIDTYRRNGMPSWACRIISEVASSRGICVSEMARKSQKPKIVKARNEATYKIKAHKPVLSTPLMAKWFGRHHTSVLHSIASHQELTGAPKLVGYNLNRDRKRKAALDRHNRLRQEAA